MEETSVMVYQEFIGRDQKATFFDSLKVIPGGGISPGGAALMLGVTRQMVGLLIYQNPEVRAWIYRDYLGQQAVYIEISVTDLLRYGVKQGRFQVGDKLPYVGVLTAEDLGTLDVLK
jgi:hypothetical protein